LTQETENLPEHQQYGMVRKVASGVFWNLLAFGFGKVSLLLVTSILARLLTKEEVGVVGAAVVAINYLTIIKDLGFGAALIQKRGDVNEAANTVFTINIILGFLLSILVIPLAPYVGNYYNDAQVTSVLRWLGVSFAINSFGAVHVVWLLRDLDYRRKALPEMGNSLVKAVVSIGMAVAGYGVWSLVAGQIAGTLTSVILVWALLPWRPRLSIDRGIATSLFKFSSSIVGSDILTVLIDNVDYLIVGRVFGLATLGVYTFAYRLPEMLVIGNLWILGSIAFPAFSSIQDKPDEMRRGFLGSVRIVELIITPIALGLILAAEPLVRVVFGDEWIEIIPILRVLAAYAWIYSIGFHVGGIYKAVGRPDILVKLSIFSIIIIIPSLLLGAHYFGVIGVAYGHLFAVIIRRAVSLFFATRFVNVTLAEIFNQIRASLRSGLAMAVGVLAVLYLTSIWSALLQLLSAAFAGAVIYLGLLWRTERENFLRFTRVFNRS
jgi:lipopolysaccharide exporter